MQSDEDCAEVIDQAVLRQVLDLGTPTLREAIILQLISDFDRIHVELDAEEPMVLNRTAHELKGLAATIGADGLRTMAAALYEHALGATQAARAAMVLGCRSEILRVRGVLDGELATFKAG